MRKYQIELNYDIYFNGQLQKNESFLQLITGKNKKDAIMQAFMCNIIAQDFTNDLFCFLGKLEIKNIKAKYKNKFIEVDKICGKQ